MSSDTDLERTPKVAPQKKVRKVLVNSFGFGEHNVSLVFAAYEGQRGEA